ncbi:hypothetical protein [Alteribacillus sp. YIM 98480]|nr:hypothetical protein [Alteribacillus sp. YIM 98480]
MYFKKPAGDEKIPSRFLLFVVERFYQTGIMPGEDFSVILPNISIF